MNRWLSLTCCGFIAHSRELPDEVGCFWTVGVSDRGGYTTILQRAGWGLFYFQLALEQKQKPPPSVTGFHLHFKALGSHLEFATLVTCDNTQHARTGRPRAGPGQPASLGRQMLSCVGEAISAGPTVTGD